MEKTILLNGSFEEMESIFNDSKQLSIRFFKEIKKNKYEVIIRYNDNLDSLISNCKTLKQLKKIAVLQFNYYQSELKRIDIKKEEIISIQLMQENKETRIFNLNLDSIVELKKFLNKLEKQLKKA